MTCRASPGGLRCVESANPRSAGVCGRCGLKLPVGVLARDVEYEREFLAESQRTAERRFGAACDGFAIAVANRLRMGQDRYGDSFLCKDLPVEALEEAWDAAAYAVLDAQKRLVGRDEDDAAAWHLFEIAVHAAAIDFHARQLRSHG